MNNFANLESRTSNKKILRLLEHYTTGIDSLQEVSDEQVETRRAFDSLIESDRFIDLTLTYDYESPTAASLAG
jgi:hypothetical protein